MTPTEKLKSLLNTEYKSEDGDTYNIKLLNGMSESEIKDYQRLFPNGYLPSEIIELLGFARGFEFQPMEEIRFDTYGHFGFEEMFPHSIPLAGDGFGNFWILDIDSNGNWNEVYYVCHDPAVVVKHSENLTDFIGHVDDFGLRLADSHLDTIHEKTVMDIWQAKYGIMEKNDKDYNFPESINRQLPEVFMTADLIDMPVGTGFFWGKYGANAKIIRVGDKPLWIIEKKLKQGFLDRLFNGFRK